MSAKLARGLLLVGLLVSLSPAAIAQAGDATNGEQVFKKCMVCHRVGEGARNLVGPQLNGVMGRKAGTIDGFNYSAINKAAGEAGLVWTPENIVDYLADPSPFLRKFLADKGNANFATQSTRMVFKLPSADERRDVIAYLQKFSPAR
jgi:cytochrome c